MAGTGFEFTTPGLAESLSTTLGSPVSELKGSICMPFTLFSKVFFKVRYMH